MCACYVAVSRLPGTPADVARAVASGNADGSLSLERLSVLIQVGLALFTLFCSQKR